MLILHGIQPYAFVYMSDSNIIKVNAAALDNLLRGVEGRAVVRYTLAAVNQQLCLMGIVLFI